MKLHWIISKQWTEMREKLDRCRMKLRSLNKWNSS